MNTWQVAKQLKYLLGKAVWPTTAKKVFGAVRFSNVTNEELMERHRMPMVIFRPGGAQSDPRRREQPELIKQVFIARMFAAVASDGIGEDALLGSNRKDGGLDSSGRGLLELEEQLISGVGRLTSINGVKIINTFRSMTDADLHNTKRHIAFREYTFEAMVGNLRFYHPSSRLSAVDNGGGSVTLTWRRAPDRFDFRDQILRFDSGATPPATTTSGTGITLSDPVNDVTVTHTPGSGTFSYSLFSVYDDLKETPTDEIAVARETLESFVVA